MRAGETIVISCLTITDSSGRNQLQEDENIEYSHSKNSLLDQSKCHIVLRSNIYHLYNNEPLWFVSVILDAIYARMLHTKDHSKGRSPVPHNELA